MKACFSLKNEVNVFVYVVNFYDLWHCKTTHLNYKSIQYMHKNNYIDPSNKDFEKKCENCIQSKIAKKHFTKVEKCTQVLELIHSNICELNSNITKR